MKNLNLKYLLPSAGIAVLVIVAIVFSPIGSGIFAAVNPDAVQAGQNANIGSAQNGSGSDSETGLVAGDNSAVTDPDSDSSEQSPDQVAGQGSQQNADQNVGQSAGSSSGSNTGSNAAGSSAGSNKTGSNSSGKSSNTGNSAGNAGDSGTGAGAGAGVGNGGAGGSTSDGGSNQAQPTILTCYIQIDCTAVLGNSDLNPSKKAYVPSNGWILSSTAVQIQAGQTAYDILQIATKKNGIQMDSNFTPGFGNAYVKGINNIYERDCGQLSGWKFSVNGSFPNTGSSQVKLNDGDVVGWTFSLKI